MKIARILYPVQVLGPGNRIAIWVCGCKRGCEGCANPELWELDEKKEIPMEYVKQMLLSILEKHKVDGITISGGEPFLQTSELDELVQFLTGFTKDILIFTGYQRRTLLQRKRDKESTERVLDTIAVLVDGKYIQEKNENHPLKGSANQRIYYKNVQVESRYEEYLKECQGKLHAQNFQALDGVIAVGIHQKDFRELVEDRLAEKGIRRES